MNAAAPINDLIILVADKNMEQVLQALMGRHQSLGIRPIRFDIRTHPERDPGCRTGGAEFLAVFKGQYAYALLMFDFEGSGADVDDARTLASQIEDRLRAHWGENGAVLAIDPELEAWIWSDSPHVDATLGWAGRAPDVRTWLESEGFPFSGGKPARPKEALEAALRQVRKLRSSSIYRQLAQKVALNRCTDVAFQRFRTLLQTWFPNE